MSSESPTSSPAARVRVGTGVICMSSSHLEVAFKVIALSNTWTVVGGTMEVPSQTSNKKRKRGPSVDARITFHTPSKTFERVFQGSPQFQFPFHAPNNP